MKKNWWNEKISSKGKVWWFFGAKVEKYHHNFLCGTFCKGDIFLTTSYGLFFTLQITLLYVGTLWAASMYYVLHLSSDLWGLIMLYLNSFLFVMINSLPWRELNLWPHLYQAIMLTIELWRLDKWSQNLFFTSIVKNLI